MARQRRRAGRILLGSLRRPDARPRRLGILQLGRPSPKAPGLSRYRIQSLLGASLSVWPHERYFVVSVFARYAIEDSGDGERYPASLRQAYGHDVPISSGRHYYGWRGESMSRRQLEEFPHLIVPGILEAFQGRRPVRCVSVRPTSI